MNSLAGDLLDVFMEEAHEVLERLHASLETLERGYSDDAFVEVRRALHTFKGGARMCGMRILSELAHAGESLVGAILSSGSEEPQARAITLLFATEYELRAALQHPDTGQGSDRSVADLTNQLRAFGSPAGVAAAQPVPAKPVSGQREALKVKDDPATLPTAAAMDAASARRPDLVEALEPPRVLPAQPSVEMPAVAQPVPNAVPVAATISSHGGLAAQLLEVFIEEAGEMLDILHTCLETLERQPEQSAMAEARRAVHTIKGGARMCGRSSVAELAHACEDVIGRPEPGNVRPPAGALPVLFEAENEMRAALDTPACGTGSDDSVHALIGRLRGLATAPAVAPQGARPTPVMANTGRPRTPIEPPPTDAVPAQGRLAGTSTSVPTQGPADETAATTAEEANEGDLFDGGPQPFPLDKPRLLARPGIPPAHNQSNRVAVDLEKVEALVTKVTEIVANRTASHGLVETLANTVSEMARAVHRLQTIAIGLQYQVTSRGYDTLLEQDTDGLDLETYGPLHQLLLQLQEAAADQQAIVQGINDIVARKRALAAVETRLDTELQSALLNMRLLPLSQLRVRLDQVVRTAAGAAEREVRWTMEGQDVALDKYVCDRLFEPLMHLLRNCVDHGIEPPDEREAAGKSRVGRIMVRASVEGNQAVVTVSDDGRGIDPDKIARIAVERGVIGADRAATLSTREKLELVFRPGFSTAKEVTELSGRGMGMEIVREVCTRMGGSVSIGKREAGGTIVVLQVPLSLSVVHCIVVRDLGRYLAIPASQVSFVQLAPPTATERSRNDGVGNRRASSSPPTRTGAPMTRVASASNCGRN